MKNLKLFFLKQYKEGLKQIGSHLELPSIKRISGGEEREKKSDQEHAKMKTKRPSTPYIASQRSRADSRDSDKDAYRRSPSSLSSTLSEKEAGLSLSSESEARSRSASSSLASSESDTARARSTSDSSKRTESVKSSVRETQEEQKASAEEQKKFADLKAMMDKKKNVHGKDQMSADEKGHAEFSAQRSAGTVAASGPVQFRTEQLDPAFWHKYILNKMAESDEASFNALNLLKEKHSSKQIPDEVFKNILQFQAKDSAGKMLIHYAAEMHHSKTLDFILSNKIFNVPPGSPSKEGKTAMQYATERPLTKDDETIKLLKAAMKPRKLPPLGRDQ